MTDLDHDVLADVFHSSAWTSYIDQARKENGWPDNEATRRAFRYYEEELMARNARARWKLTAPTNAARLQQNVEVSNG